MTVFTVFILSPVCCHVRGTSKQSQAFKGQEMESYFKTLVTFHLRLCERLLFLFLAEETRSQIMMDCGVVMPGDPSSVWRRAVTLVTTSVAIMMTYCLAADHPSSFSSWSCSFHSSAPVTDKDFLPFLIFPFRCVSVSARGNYFFSKEKSHLKKYLLKICFTCFSGTAGRRTATCGCTCWCWATRCAGAKSRPSASAAWRHTRRPAALRSVDIFCSYE